MIEAVIQRAVIAHLNTIEGVDVWRMNTGGMEDDDGNFVRFGLPGQADITGMLPDGRRLEVEVKAPGKTLSKKQEAYRARILRRRGVYVWGSDIRRIVAEVRAIAEASR